MKTYLRVISIVFLFASILLFATSYFPACNQNYGDELDCDFPYGARAVISGPAKVKIFASGQFTVGYLSNGILLEFSTTSDDGIYQVNLSSDGPMELFMLQSAGGIDDPYISVDDLAVHNTIKVTRTWYNLPVQVYKWYMFPMYLMLIIMALLPILVIEIDKLGKRQL